jgi:hypothetical protein
MTKKELFQTAHKMTKEIKNEFPEVSYRMQFGIVLKALYSEKDMSIKDQIKEVFETRAKRWAQSVTTVTINSWKEQRIYINIQHHTFKTSMYIDIKTLNLYTQSNNANTALRESCELAKEVIKNNLEKIVEEYK